MKKMRATEDKINNGKPMSLIFFLILLFTFLIKEKSKCLPGIRAFKFVFLQNANKGILNDEQRPIHP